MVTKKADHAKVDIEIDQKEENNGTRTTERWCWRMDTIMITTVLVLNNNREVMMTTTIFLSLFGIALMIKLIGEMI